MKKFTLLTISVFALQVLFSQPILTNSLNLTIGDTFRSDSYIEATSTDPGSGGANMTWDFGTISGGTYVEGEGVICVNPTTTPFADSAAVANANICTRAIETPNEGYFHYFECNSTSQYLNAFGLLESGSGSFGTYTNQATILEFPFTYGDNYEDTSDQLIYNLDWGYYYHRDSAIVTVEADAYGTIITPAGEFQNVLRLKKTTIDYSWMNYDNTEWIPLGSFTDIQYTWYAPNIKIPVMSIFEAEWLPGSYTVNYLVEYNFPTGIEEQLDYHIEIYPIPTSDRLTINTVKKFNSVNIYSANGQKMDVSLLQSNPSQQQTFDLSKYPKGVYLIEVGFEDGNFTTKKIIKE